MLDNTTNQPSKFSRKNSIEINDDSSKTYNTNSQVQFKKSMLKSNLCDYNYSYILVSRTLTVVGAGEHDSARAADRSNKRAIFKNCAPFTDCITEIKNTQVENASDADV